LTGSNRANIDYILENVLDPSAVVGRDYKLTVVLAKDGRLMSGIVREQSARTLTLQTANETIIIAAEDVAQLTPSEVSMMPENIFDTLSPEEIRDLAAYLGAAAQVPLPENDGGKEAQSSP
jgi:putative heme-binding domain-containing protein